MCRCGISPSRNRRRAAQAEVDAAQKALTDAQNNLTSIETSAAGSGFVQIETNLANAEASYNVANDLNNRVQNGTNIDQLTRFGLYQLAKQENQPIAKQNSSRLSDQHQQH